MAWSSQDSAVACPVSSASVVVVASERDEAIESPRIALERLVTQHPDDAFLGRDLSRPTVLLHPDRHRQDPLHVGPEIADASAASGWIAGPTRLKPAVL